MSKNALLNLVALGLVGSAASIVLAADVTTLEVPESQHAEVFGVGANPGRPFLINISGATLMQNFITAPGSTNDFLDVDADGNAIGTPGNEIDNLAGSLPTVGGGYNTALWWVVQYRATGSVNGLQELIDFGTGCATAPDTGINPQGTNPAVQNNAAAQQMSSDLANPGFINANQYAGAGGDPLGTASALWNAANPGALPIRTFCTGTIPAGKYSYSAVPVGPLGSQPGGVRIDLSPIDVPTLWGTTRPGTPAFADGPSDAGYGLNPRLNRTKSGAIFVDGAGNNFGFRLVTVSSPFRIASQIQSGDPAADQFTLFDTDFAYAPVAYMTNHGVGYSSVSYSFLRHLVTTGRTNTGENLMAILRDTGSGTHNAAVNSLCIDPSHGVGEGIGGLSNSAAEQQAGPSFNPGNKGGSGALENTVFNTRLGIGTSGAERGTTGTGSGTWILDGDAEALSVLDDLRGGTVAARPNIRNVLGFSVIDFTPSGNPAVYDHVPLANRFNGYNIGGPGVLATLGDPRSNNNIDDFTGQPVVGTDVSNAGPAMRNPQAAAYINNITRSRDSFSALGPNDATLFSPGEVLARTLIINGSRAFVQSRTNPCDLLAFDAPGGTPLNPALVATVASTNALNNAAWNDGNYGSVTFFGKTVTRFNFTDTAAGTTTETRRYSDTAGSNDASPSFDRRVFVRQDGTTVGYANTGLRNRNRIAGDFDGNGLRNVNDAEQMLRAFNDRINRPAVYGATNTGLTAPSVADRTAWQGGITVNATFGDRATNWVAPAGTGAIAGAPGSDAIIEQLGDFNNDGNFGRTWDNAGQVFVNDTSDIRYWADGLAIDPTTGRLNRAAGFLAVDNAALAVLGNGNFFGTTLANGTYSAGDSAGDVAGSGNFTIGFAPIGHDGVINAADIDYVFAQFARNPNVTDGTLNWSNLAESQYAVNAFGEQVGNLSADITGDLIVDINDIDRLFQILETTRCDVNLDGVVDAADRSIIEASIGTSNFGFANGDVDGNGAVTQADLQFCFAAPVCCPGDSDDNGTINFSDITSTLANFGSTTVGGTNGNGDADCSGTVNFSDITTVLANFGSTCN
jgi:hypothetical protein